VRRGQHDAGGFASTQHGCQLGEHAERAGSVIDAIRNVPSAIA
jgi:hypothetical protein